MDTYLLTIDRSMGTTIGERIRELREARKWSMGQLEMFAGLGNGYVSQVESGKRVPKPTTLAKIASALNVPIDILTGKS